MRDVDDRYKEHISLVRWRMCSMENGEWRMENGVWSMGNGEWRMENGEWRMDLHHPPFIREGGVTEKIASCEL